MRRAASLVHIITICACTPTTRRTPDDTLVVISPEPMQSADPRYAISSYDSKLSKLVYNGLTALDTDDSTPRPDLAEKWERVDAMTYDVTVAADARFSDGSPVTAADVAYTYTALLDPQSDSLFHRGFSERFSRVEAIAPRVARFHLLEPLATFASDIDMGIMQAAPSHLGAGPYVLRDLTDARALLDANPYYRPGPPKTPHLEIRVVRNDAARMLMMVGGSADLIQNGARYDLVDEVLGRPRVTVAKAPSVILTYLMMNNDDPQLADVRVRRAIALALDRPAIIAAKFGGRATLATGMIPPQHWAYEPHVTTYARDLARARALLAEAGATHLHLTYKTSTDAFRVTLAKVIAAQLAEVGIEVDVRSFEFATFFVDIKRGNYQLASMQTGEINEPDLLFNYFHSSRIPVPTNPDGGNRWRYRNAEVDRLTTAGRHELDVAKRKQLYARVQQILADDVPIVPLWHEDNVVLANVGTTGYRITPNGRLIGLVSTVKAPE